MLISLATSKAHNHFLFASSLPFSRASKQLLLSGLPAARRRQTLARWMSQMCRKWNMTHPAAAVQGYFLAVAGALRFVLRFVCVCGICCSDGWQRFTAGAESALAASSLLAGAKRRRSLMADAPSG